MGAWMGTVSTRSGKAVVLFAVDLRLLYSSSLPIPPNVLRWPDKHSEDRWQAQAATAGESEGACYARTKTLAPASA